MPNPNALDALDDMIEVVIATTPPPFTVESLFPGTRIARTIEVIGGGDLTLKTPGGPTRVFTALSNPWGADLKFTEILAVTTATKLRIGV